MNPRWLGPLDHSPSELKSVLLPLDDGALHRQDWEPHISASMAVSYAVHFGMQSLTAKLATPTGFEPVSVR